MNISKFNWQELFSNDTGKTSMTAFIGGLTCICSLLIFVKAGLTNNYNLIDKTTMVLGIGSGILVGRKILNGKEIITDVTKIEESNDDTKN